MNRPIFVQCKLTTIQYRTYTITNHPININLIVRIRKAKEAYYPDNTGIPAIEFDTEQKTDRQLKWCYNKQQDRDEDYERILKKFNSVDEALQDKRDLQQLIGPG
jgi:hypothetical protein